MHLSRPLTRACEALGYKKPTPIQAAVIPIAMTGRDVCGRAVTGSGKTAAFMLPQLERMLHRGPRPAAATHVLVLVPTRELAVQVHQMTESLAQFTTIRAVLVVGGLSANVQAAALRTRPEIVVATPGRVIDHVRNTHSFGLEDLATLILDEADRLLEMGFLEEIKEIVRQCPKKRQTLLFSATLTAGVEALASLSMKNPARLSADTLGTTPKRLVEEVLKLKPNQSAQKEAFLMAIVSRSYDKSTIIFSQTKQEAHRLKIIMGLSDIKAGELHGDMTQTQRLAALDEFRTGTVTHLIATDVAARGLDIPSVDAVISFDAPKTLASYLHRVGRTARAGKKGTALTFMEESDRKLVKTIAKRGANLKARIVPGNIVAEWHKKIEDMEEQIVQINYEERTERQLQKAEMEANKASNILEHAAEIKSRPAKTWFQSERDKRNVQKDALKAMETAEMDLMDRKSHRKGAKRRQEAAGPDRLPDSKRARRKLAQQALYKKERGDDDTPRGGFRVTKGVKSVKAIEREARLTGGVATKVVRMVKNARDPKAKAKRAARAAAHRRRRRARPILRPRRRFPRRISQARARRNRQALQIRPRQVQERQQVPQKIVLATRISLVPSFSSRPPRPLVVAPRFRARRARARPTDKMTRSRVRTDPARRDRATRSRDAMTIASLCRAPRAPRRRAVDARRRRRRDRAARDRRARSTRARAADASAAATRPRGDVRTRSKPPQRDTGIAKEDEAFEDADDEDDGAAGASEDGARGGNRETSTSVEENGGMKTTRKRGFDRGEGGYQSRWWTTKRDCPDGRSGSSETRWAKCDFSGYKELGFEKSGFNDTGETWWETWREIYCRDDFTGVEHIERSADKWARDAQSKEWQEKWWERYYANGAVERGVEKSGREVRQAWWEKWGEQYDGEGATLKWTDKWAENGMGMRWGDKWEERRSKIGSGRKSGETWRVGQDGERFSRTWGEVLSPDGSVRKFGNSTTGESWDTTVVENVYFDKSKPPTWQEVLSSSERLMSIELTPVSQDDDDDDDKWSLARNAP